MILDALLQLSAAQAITATAFSTNVVDLSQARDIGPGKDLYVMFTVDTSFTAAGAATLNFQIVTSANSNLSSPTILAQTDAIGKAELTAGHRPIVLNIPQAQLTALPIGQRYLGVQYTVTTGPMTAGAVTAYITDSEVSVNQNYPSGFAVA